ncbi:tyrosine-type recombinase/integrase [Streptomyces anulatus]|uniref:tyrosine-type recombinase/integrase n=1 Tax=Streptomyces anulatus TaxID=1892 RepID=UPI000B05A929|nr:tyrosine-type recombinase/integrase [Streptomyces anulatus]WTC61833.1 tyrosine-type recombinase/integrase [Streptomyces anulatus]
MNPAVPVTTRWDSGRLASADGIHSAIPSLAPRLRIAPRGNSDLTWLTVLNERALQYKGTKGKRAHKVPIVEEIHPLIAQHILSAGPNPDARLFTDPRGGRISTAVLRDATHWDDVVTKLGYEHLRRHDPRHTALTWFADAGVQVHVLRRIAGHGSLTTTQRCLRPDVHKITAAGAALSAHFNVLRAPRSLPSPVVMTR